MAEYALDVWDRSVWFALRVGWNRGVDSGYSLRLRGLVWRRKASCRTLEEL